MTVTGPGIVRLTLAHVCGVQTLFPQWVRGNKARREQSLKIQEQSDFASTETRLPSYLEDLKPKGYECGDGYKSPLFSSPRPPVQSQK